MPPPPLRLLLLRLAAVFITISLPLFAQDTPDPKDEKPADARGDSKSDKKEDASEPKSYDKVITKDAKTDDGVFKVHRVKSKLYYEIPSSQLGAEFLWVTQIA